MNKIRKIKINDIKPADYNPRILTQNAFENLQNSIKKLGVLKPIIVHAENNTIVAGHQRTRAMKSQGMVYDDGITRFVVQDARRIDIVERDSYALEAHGNDKWYNTCRNWRFAYQCVHNEKFL